MAESQEQQTVEQQPAPQPVELKTYESQDALTEAVKSGEVDVRQYKSPDEMVNALVKSPEETPQQEPQQDVSRETLTQEAPQQEPPAKAPEQKEEKPLFKSFGEMLKFAKDELGEEYENAHDFIQKVKNKKEHLTRNQSALNRWREDATKNKQVADSLKKQLETLQSQLKDVQQKQQQPVPQRQQQVAGEDEYTEPEIPMPDDLADTKEWVDYSQKVAARDKRIFEKRMEKRLSDMEKRSSESEKKWQQRLEEEKAKVRRENDERIKREAADRMFENTVSAADKFLAKRKELDYGVPTKEMNDRYGKFVASVDYVKSQNPAYSQRDLVSDYFNGVPDAVELFNQYAIEPPEGAKQFAVLMELEKIANNHQLYTNKYTDSAGRVIGGDPDFDAAYAIKKARDGADIDELNQAHARGAEQALNVVQERQRNSGTELSARETVPHEEQPKENTEQLMQRMQLLQSQMSTMNPEQLQQAKTELASMAQKIGLVEQQT